MSIAIETHALQTQKLIYEATTNRNYIRQYATLLQRQYQKELNLTVKNIEQEAVNSRNPVFIIREGHKIIGGAKLFISDSIQTKLPMESTEFSTVSILPQGCNIHTRAEIGRLVIDPDYRGGEIIYSIISTITKHAIHQGCSHLFVLAPPINAVLYRRVCTALGMPTRIRKDITVPVKPEYQGLGLRLLSCDLRKMTQQQTYDVAV